MTTEIAAGPDLDAAVAEEVMGWTRESDEVGDWWAVADSWLDVDEFKPSTTWDGAGLVVARMRELGWDFEAGSHPEFTMRFFPPADPFSGTEGYGVTFPEAVARAALAAVRG